MPNKQKILIFGNLLVEGDNLGLKLMNRLQEKFSKIEFIELDPTEDLQNYGRDLRIIDAVVGINEVREIKLESLEDFNKVEIGRVYSMHDFDLGYNLKLLKKMKMIDSVEIICVPMVGDGGEGVGESEGNEENEMIGEEEIFREICEILNKIN